jgi:hypothetical protein
MVLHPLKDDNAAAWRLDAVYLRVELVAQPVFGDLVFNQQLCAFTKALLNLANAHAPKAGH